MTNAQSDSSARDMGAPDSSFAPCEEDPKVLEQLQHIEGRLSDLTADRLPTDSPVAASSASQIQEALACQTASLQALTDGLRQLQQHITTDVIGAIENLSLATKPTETSANVTEPESAAETPDPESASPQHEVGSTSSDPNLSSWEMIRQAMLETEEDDSVPSAVEETAVSEAPSEPVDQSEADDLPEEPERLEFVVPDPFDCDSIEDESLRQVFLEREEILRLMSIRLLHTTQPKPAMTTEQLRELSVTLPDDLRARVEASLAQLDEQLRLTELELSLERARMARQRTRLEDTRHRVETNARHLGYKISEDGTLEETAESTERTGRSGRRWLRVLGFGG